MLEKVSRIYCIAFCSFRDSSVVTWLSEALFFSCFVWICISKYCVANHVCFILLTFHRDFTCHIKIWWENNVCLVIQLFFLYWVCFSVKRKQCELATEKLYFFRVLFWGKYSSSGLQFIRSDVVLNRLHCIALMIYHLPFILLSHCVLCFSLWFVVIK